MFLRRSSNDAALALAIAAMIALAGCQKKDAGVATETATPTAVSRQ